MKAIRSSHSLKGNARLVAFDAHLQIGLESVSNGTEFPDTKKELTAAYLAMFTGLSENKARDWMKEACRLGFFRRVDNGKGGRNNSNRATYLPTVPQWFS
ncbi:hypothetical protein AD017_08910 [Pseudonocardia sp. EC080619-01]|nr:hypothetical protein AD017_08910 [Pseudonocardia sp. EC080619-01]